jgi:hypothetical protein
LRGGVAAALAVAVALAALAADACTSPAAGAGGPARFAAHVSRLSPTMRHAMRGVSWRRGCPVALGALRVVRLRFWGFDRRTHTGRLIVHARIGRRTVRAFRGLYAARFPIRRMRPVDAYGGSDAASMAADNTSAFNCRRVTGGRRWSQHAYGRAIDVDPRENPYVDGSTVLPPAGGPYRDRSRPRRGMILAGGPVTRAFAAAGLSWGGEFTGRTDYQHFERRR